jgi:hypothetical protein
VYSSKSINNRPQPKEGERNEKIETVSTQKDNVPIMKILLDLDYSYDDFYINMRDFIIEHIKLMAQLFQYKILKIEETKSRNNNVHIYITVQYDGDVNKLAHFLYSLGDDPNHTRLSLFRYKKLGTFITFCIGRDSHINL